MIEKYKKGEVVIPTKFRVVAMDASKTGLTLHIQPLNDIKLDDLQS